LCPWIWRRNGIVTGVYFWRDDDVFVLYFVLENNLKRERERERERELLVLNNPVWRFLG
jgi:hypothetical protein